MPSRRLLLVLTGLVALVAVAGASGEPVNAYTAAGTPQHVKPSTAATHTIALTNDALSPTEADRAKIGIPVGFVVSAASVNASANAAGSCISSTWVADGTLIAGGKINLKRPGGGSNSRLCPGATLTVVFSATSSPAEGLYTWTTELLRGDQAFVLGGAQPTVQVDGTAPVVTLTSSPPDPSNETSPSFAFTASEPANLECKLDSGAFAACTSPKGYADLVDGSHAFAVKATDAAGNTGATVSYTWLIETTLPIVTLTEKPSPASNSSAAAFAFTTSKPATVECKLDDGALAACTSPANYTDLVDGLHTFTAKATDSAANTGPETTYGWTVDTVAPVATITDKPTSLSNDPSASFQFSASEAVGFQCKLDEAAFAPCTSPKTYTPGDGAHTFTVKARDAAGNTGQASHTWTLDTVPPTTTITHKPANPSNDPSPTFEFSASEAAGFQCKLDGAAFGPCISPKGYSPGDGSHTFTVKATDTAGNTGPVASGTWTIDTVAPTTTITQKPANPMNSSSATFRFSASEAVTFQCKLDADVFATCTSPQGYLNLENGAHTFTVKPTDTAGNAGVETSYAWTIDTVAPVATITQHPDDPSGVSSATFAFSSEPGASFQCELDSGSFAPCTSPKSYSVGDGSHTFAVKATDGAQNTGPEATYTWFVDTIRPVVTLTEKPANPTNSPTATFSFIANKTANYYECKLDGGPFAACTSSQSYAGLADGSHTFAIRANGVAGTGPETLYTWTIDTVGPASAITAKPSDPTNNRSATFVFAASEPATFQCKLDGAAFASCASPQAYSNLVDGRHSFVVKATDSVSNVGTETAYEWTIETRAPGVTLTSVPTSLTNSTIARLAFTADEPATFQCKLDDRAMEPCSSPASYAGLGDGGHAFAVRATDLAGNVGAATYSWAVDATPAETTLDSRPRASTTATSARFTFSAGGPATFQCRLDSASFSTCTSPKTYAGLAIGTHRFAVRAIDAAGNVDPTPSESTWTVTRVSKKVATTALFAPTAGARVTRPPLLRWRPAPRATYYNVQLYRSGRKVLSAWPARTRLQLKSRWRFNGRAMQLKPGRYQWFVWPGYGRPSVRRYGKLLGSSTFVVGRAVTRR